MCIRDRVRIDTMELSDLFARMTGRRREPERPELPRVPTSDDLLAALDGVEAMVAGGAVPAPVASRVGRVSRTCLLYTSDAADDLTRVDLGGRRILKKQ